MSKIIIHNDSELNDDSAVTYVMAVLRNGRISEEGKSYCYGTVWQNGVQVFARRNKKSDTFYVTQRAV